MGFSSGQVEINGAVASGTPIPTSDQAVHRAFVYYTTSATYYQIATPDASHDVYFLGFGVTNSNAASPYIVIFDAAAGNMPAPTANTLYTDDTGDLFLHELPTAHVYEFQLNVPYKCKNGLRLHAGNAGASGKLFVDYMIVTK